MGSDFCTNLKNLRKAAGLTQTEFSERLNVHLQTVSKWERGISEPDISQYGKIAEVLGTALETLFGLPAPEKPLAGTFDAERLGKNISALRKAAREDQKQLAAVTDVSVDTVSKWERAVICPSIAKLMTVSDHYGLSLSALYYGEGSPAAVISPREQGRRAPLKRIVFPALAVFLAGIIVLIVILTVPSRKTHAPSALSKPQNVRAVDGIALWDSVDNAVAYELRLNDGLPISLYDDTTVFDLSSVLAGECEVRICVRAVASGSYRDSPWSDGIDYTYTGPHTHSYGAVVTDVPAGDHTNGRAHKTCGLCGAETAVVLPGTAHSYTATVFAPTCTEGGYTRYVCSCGDSYSDNFVPAAGHTVETIAAVPATCTTHGSTEGKRCSACRKVLALSEQTPVLGHSFSGMTCENCHLTITPTSDEYLDFVPSSQGAYTARPKDVKNLPEEVVIPREWNGIEVTSIESFEGARELASLIFFPTVRDIGFMAFRDCDALESVYFMGTLEQWLGVDMRLQCFCRPHDLYINGALMSDLVIPDGTTEIMAYAFNECRNFKTVRIPDSVTKIGGEAFAECKGLKQIYIPYSVTEIGAYAMPGNESILTIYCEAPRQPSGWDNSWNWADCRVVWNYTPN